MNVHIMDTIILNDEGNFHHVKRHNCHIYGLENVWMIVEKKTSSKTYPFGVHYGQNRRIIILLFFENEAGNELLVKGERYRNLIKNPLLCAPSERYCSWKKVVSVGLWHLPYRTWNIDGYAKVYFVVPSSILVTKILRLHPWTFFL